MDGMLVWCERRCQRRCRSRLLTVVQNYEWCTFTSAVEANRRKFHVLLPTTTSIPTSLGTFSGSTVKRSCGACTVVDVTGSSTLFVAFQPYLTESSNWPIYKLTWRNALLECNRAASSIRARVAKLKLFCTRDLVNIVTRISFSEFD
ncbi:hypothetical protein AVEN_18915-1 [Araneus ventricosus]|uniref:Uncharacterized protein n=1 Tax=Araneus ventricosus TaxID=182803 RepID=A0A4Y2SST5_ARAVE|nr:hypothetical protein AVEN_18915-1 [Araneus ventricosus]